MTDIQAIAVAAALLTVAAYITYSSIRYNRLFDAYDRLRQTVIYIQGNIDGINGWIGGATQSKTEVVSPDENAPMPQMRDGGYQR